VRVVIADDECMFRASLRQLLSVPSLVVKQVYGVDVGPGFEVVGEAQRAKAQYRGDYVRLGPTCCSTWPCRACLVSTSSARIAASSDATRTIVLSGGLDRSRLQLAVQLGARGVVLKDSATEGAVSRATTRVMAGQSGCQTLIADLMDVVRNLPHQPAGAARPFGLTPREREVLSLVVEGCPNKEIAQRFAVSEETIKHHLTRMFDKVGAANRLELALTATRNGLVN
jgi:DNA-binding NarL/FixJ family response regulator